MQTWQETIKLPSRRLRVRELRAGSGGTVRTLAGGTGELGEEATHGDTAEAHHTNGPSLPGVLEPDTHLWDRRPDSRVEGMGSWRLWLGEQAK